MPRFSDAEVKALLAEFRAVRDARDAKATPQFPADDTPSYYRLIIRALATDAMEVIAALGLNFHLGCAMKYIWRAGKKTPDPLPDLRKARNCIDREIARLEALESKDGSESNPSVAVAEVADLVPKQDAVR